MFLSPKFQKITHQNRIRFIGVLILIIYYPKVLAQNNDTLRNKNYKELSDLFYQNRKEDTIKAEKYAKVYLGKARASNDTIKIADGFLFLARISDQYSQLKYYDSVIHLTKHLDHKKYPAEGYFRKGTYFFYKRDFKKSLDLHLDAYGYAKRNNSDLAFTINHNIGILRVRLGDHKKSLEVFKNSFNYVVDKNYKTKGRYRDYLRTIFALSNAYRRSHILDSANYYCDLGIKESLSIKNEEYYNFLLTKGILQYENKEFDSAISNILKSQKFHEENNNDNPNLAFAYFYYAKALLEKNNVHKAIKNFKKVDSIFQLQNDIHPELRESYKTIIDYYKKNKNKNLQLEYIEKLVKVDSVLNINYKYLTKKINIKYDTSTLISEKENLIQELKKKKRASLIGYVLLTGVTTVLVFLFIYNFKKKKIYKQKFDQLMLERKISFSQSENIESNDTLNTEKNIGISKTIVKQILSDLDKFVEEEGYLNKNLTVGYLSKKMETNSKYLSKVVNTYKKNSFINYINDLRINYSIERLKNDNRFRKYTIKAISEAVGFSNPASFSQAFHKKTGIKPSYFIKKLEQTVNSSPNS